jgi:hypothetical protein
VPFGIRTVSVVASSSLTTAFGLATSTNRKPCSVVGAPLWSMNESFMS